MEELSPFINVDPDENLINELSNCEYITVEGFQEILSEPNFFNITNYNIRSFHQNISHFLGIFENNILPQVLVFSETWFNEENSIELPNFSSFHMNRLNRRSGGISVYVVSNIISYKIHSLCFSNDSIEISTVCVKFNGRYQYILAIYRPHTGTISEFIEFLTDILNNTLIFGKPCFLVGDFNINLLLDTPEVESFKNFMYSHSFVSFITRPTRFRENNAPSILDHIWGNHLSFFSSGIVLYDLTDHYPTYIRIPFFKKTIETTTIKFRNFSQSQNNVFSNFLQTFDWTRIKCNNVDKYTENFVSVLNNIYNISFPFQQKNISNKHLNNIWMTPMLRKLIKYKSQYLHLFKMGLVTASENRYFCNRVKEIVKHSKKLFFKRLIDLNRNNISKTWKTLKFLLNGNTNINHVKHLVVNGINLTEPHEIANAFNNYFSSIATNLSLNLPNSNIDPISYISTDVPSSIFFNPISNLECEKIISSLKNSKQGTHNIPVRLIKQYSNILAPILCDIINECFTTGKFPNILKHAHITPILKGGDSLNCKNYRPISVLPFFSKVFERTIYIRLYDFICQHSLIVPSQYGFLRGLSTEKAITSLTEFLYDTLDRKEIALTVFIDFKKAFDMVNHEMILISKLYRYGIRGVSLDLFKSYLTNRTQSVKISNYFSQPSPITLGVPQGSILGPILFLLYINDLPNFSEKAFTLLYADDTSLSFRSNDLVSAYECSNYELLKFYEWTVSNKFIVNLEKSNYMVVTNRNVDLSSRRIFINDVFLDRVSSCKFLGLILDENLTFKLHCSHVSKKISKSIGVVCRVRDYLDFTSLKMLYFSLIYPYLFYCNLIWGGTGNIHLNPIFVLQKRAVRIISNCSFQSHSNPLFIFSKILKLADIHRYNLGCFMYSHFSEEVYIRNSSHNTRFSHHLLPTFRRLNVSQQSITYLGPVFWNSLPDDLKNIPSLKIFKKRLINYLLSLYED